MEKLPQEEQDRLREELAKLRDRPKNDNWFDFDYWSAFDEANELAEIRLRQSKKELEVARLKEMCEESAHVCVDEILEFVVDGSNDDEVIFVGHDEENLEFVQISRAEVALKREREEREREKEEREHRYRLELESEKQRTTVLRQNQFEQQTRGNLNASPPAQQSIELDRIGTCSVYNNSKFSDTPVIDTTFVNSNVQRCLIVNQVTSEFQQRNETEPRLNEVEELNTRPNLFSGPNAKEDSLDNALLLNIMQAVTTPVITRALLVPVEAVVHGDDDDDNEDDDDDKLIPSLIYLNTDKYESIVDASLVAWSVKLFKNSHVCHSDISEPITLVFAVNENINGCDVILPSKVVDGLKAHLPCYIVSPVDLLGINNDRQTDEDQDNTINDNSLDNDNFVNDNEELLNNDTNGNDKTLISRNIKEFKVEQQTNNSFLELNDKSPLVHLSLDRENKFLKILDKVLVHLTLDQQNDLLKIIDKLQNCCSSEFYAVGEYELAFLFNSNFYNEGMI